MGNLSKHFSREEFACKCGCGFDTIDAKTLEVAEIVRSIVGPYSPSSACRCVSHNKKVGGSSRSQHLIGRAIDIPSKNPIALYEQLDSMFPDTYGLGVYKSFVHFDSGNRKARWHG